MSEITIQENRFNIARRLVARELAHLIAVREAGFCLGEVQISSPGNQKPYVVRRSSLGLFDAAKKYGSKTYMEKRLFVLCAAGLGESLVVLSEKDKSGEACTGDEFWECFQVEDWSVFPGRAATSDYDLACEIATAYRSLTNDDDASEEPNLTDEFHCHAMFGLMSKFGIAALVKLFTQREFLKLVDCVVEREINQDGTLRNGVVTLGEAEIDAYVPSKPDYGSETKGLPDKDNGRTLDNSNIIQSGKIHAEIQRIFAHELGHWLAAKILGIRTSGVKIEWERHGIQYYPWGHCTVFLGGACITLGFEQYLESRIATIATGSLADCDMRFPEEEAIGSELYKTLHFGGGKGDLEKLAELVVIHGAMHLTYRYDSAPVGRELNQGQVLETIVGVLNRSKLWSIIRSTEYRSFIHEIIEQQQKAGVNDWMVERQIKIEITTDQISSSLKSHEGLTALIEKQRSS